MGWSEYVSTSHGSLNTPSDGDSLSYLWFHYPEAGTYKKTVNISPENYRNVWINTPKIEDKETIHVVLKMNDKGTPSLSRYIRIILTILPEFTNTAANNAWAI